MSMPVSGAKRRGRGRGHVTYANVSHARECHVAFRCLCLLSPLSMTSRINIARPVAPSYNADPHGFSNSRPSSGYRAANPDDPLEKLRVFGKQVEDAIEVYSQPLRPHLPAIGRFLIVVTFYEDALRIVTQWSDQLWYLQTCVFIPCFATTPHRFQQPQALLLGHFPSFPLSQCYCACACFLIT